VESYIALYENIYLRKKYLTLIKGKKYKKLGE